MASDINHFGIVSDGVDRAQIGVAPPVQATTNLRPPPEALNYQKPSIRQAIGDNLLSVVVHPQYGIKKIRAAVKEKREVTAKERQKDEHRDKQHEDDDDDDDDHVPTLAPLPPFASIEDQRLEHDLNEKSKFPPAKDFMDRPFSALQSVVQDQRGSDFAENITKSEVAHGASVQLVRQRDKVAAAKTESEKAAEVETLVQMKQLRQDAYVRWTIDRHVRRVGRTQLMGEPPVRPPLFGKETPETAVKTWKIYAGDVSLKTSSLSSLLTT